MVSRDEASVGVDKEYPVAEAVAEVRALFTLAGIEELSMREEDELSAVEISGAEAIMLVVLMAISVVLSKAVVVNSRLDIVVLWAAVVSTIEVDEVSVNIVVENSGLVT